MTRLSDLRRLAKLRSHREERARAAVAAAAARLRTAHDAVEDADAALAEHDEAASVRERRFLDAMGIRPFSGGEVARGQDHLAIAGHRRDELLELRQAASANVSACRDALETSRSEWRARLRARDTLDEARARLEQVRRAEVEAASELEADEESADRRGQNGQRAR